MFVLSNPLCPQRDGGNFVESRQFAFSRDQLRSEPWNFEFYSIFSRDRIRNLKFGKETSFRSWRMRYGRRGTHGTQGTQGTQGTMSPRHWGHRADWVKSFKT